MNVNVPVELFNRLLHQAERYAEICVACKVAGTDAVPEAKRLLESAQQRQASGELNRAEAYEAASREEIVEVDGCIGQWKIRQGCLVYRRTASEVWMFEPSKMFPWYEPAFATGWRIVRPDPPTMGFMEATKQCIWDRGRRMKREDGVGGWYSFSESGIWRSEEEFGHAIFEADDVQQQWTVQDAKGNYYTASGERWGGKS